MINLRRPVAIRVYTGHLAETAGDRDFGALNINGVTRKDLGVVIHRCKRHKAAAESVSGLDIIKEDSTLVEGHSAASQEGRKERLESRKGHCCVFTCMCVCVAVHFSFPTRLQFFPNYTRPFRVWIHLVIYQETARGPHGRNTSQ